MTIKTKFNIGEKVFTIDTNTFKVKDFVVSRISTYTSDGKTNVTLYDGDSYTASGHDESKCFATEAELLNFVTSKEQTNAKAL